MSPAPGEAPVDRALRTGVVVAFDEAAGFGTVGDAETGLERWFHCTAIADGSRTIAAGSTVTFSVVAGATGRWEAANLRPAG